MGSLERGGMRASRRVGSKRYRGHGYKVLILIVLNLEILLIFVLLAGQLSKKTETVTFDALGIAFTLPAEGYKYRRNVANKDFPFATIEKTAGGKSRETEWFLSDQVQCYLGGPCMVVRAVGALFPDEDLQSAEDVKDYLNRRTARLGRRQEEYALGLAEEWEENDTRYAFYKPTTKPIPPRALDILIIEPRNPQNLVAVIKDSHDDELESVAKSVRVIGGGPSKPPLSEKTRYVNDALGVSFEYPAAWGGVTVKNILEGEGCEDKPELNIDGSCGHFNITFTDIDGRIIAATKSRSLLEYVKTLREAGRHEKWNELNFGDKVYNSSVEKFCERDIFDWVRELECTIYRTRNGVLVARSVEFDSFSNAEEALYMMHSGNPNFTGFIVSSGGFENLGSQAREQINELVESIKFNQQRSE